MNTLEPSPAELSDSTVELEEWDRLHVQDYWDAVITEELGAPLVNDELEPPQATTSPYEWSTLGSGERVRLRRHQRRAENTALRTVATAADSIVSAPNPGEAA